MRLTGRVQTTQRGPLLQAVKVAVATIGSWFAASWLLSVELPIFAAIAALLVVQPSVNQSMSKAIERTVGVIVGVLLASAIGAIFGENSWIILLAIVAAIFLSWVFKLAPGAANQVPITAMLVLALGTASPDYAVDRILETVMGAVIGLIVNLAIVPPVLLRPAREKIELLTNEIAATLEGLVEALTTPQSRADRESLMIRARLLRPMKDAADAAVRAGEESLTLNPRQSAHRTALEDTRQLLTRLTPIVNRVIGMTRAFRDHYDNSLSTEPAVLAIAEELSRAAHDLRLLLRPEDTRDLEPVTADLPALTAPLVILKPHPDHWILIGSFMEDLRRIREEIVGD